MSTKAEEIRDDKTAPDPNDPDKPDKVTEVEGRSWRYVLLKTVREFSSDACTDIAAALTYFFVLALFPALVAVFSLLGVFGQGDAAAKQVLSLIDQIAPGGAADTLTGPIRDIVNSPGAGLAVILGIVLAIWSASGYVGAFSRGMNRIYEIEEGRGFIKLKSQQLLVTVIGIALVAIALLILVISGPVTDAIGAALGIGPVVQTVWSIVKWPVLAFVIVLMVAILYYATPNAKQPKFRWTSMGALIAIFVLALATLGFGFYVGNFGNYNKTYGSLAGVIIFLLWIWIANIALLFGAEFDAELERGRQLQAGIAAEEDIQLPPRDTKKIDKRAEQEEKDVAEGRRIREQHDDDPSNDDDADTKGEKAKNDKKAKDDESKDDAASKSR